MAVVQAHAAINIITDEAAIQSYSSPKGKPFLKITIGSVCIRITSTLAEMIGGAGRGLRHRMEDLNDPRYVKVAVQDYDLTSLDGLSAYAEALFPDFRWLVRSADTDDEEAYFASLVPRGFVGGRDDPDLICRAVGQTAVQALFRVIEFKRGKRN